MTYLLGRLLLLLLVVVVEILVLTIIIIIIIEDCNVMRKVYEKTKKEKKNIGMNKINKINRWIYEWKK